MSYRITGLIVISLFVSTAAMAGFSWDKGDGKTMDLSYDGKKVVQYVYQPYDDSNDARRVETYKVFHHVYRTDGKRLLTKGPGGKFTHHRGIYYGFSKVSWKGHKGTVDTWHCHKGTHISHIEFLENSATADKAVQQVKLGWYAPGDELFAYEIRTLTISRNGVDLVVDFKSELQPLVEGMQVNGDPQHAGFQFRAHNDVAAKFAKQTYYLRPDGIDAPGKTRNWPGSKDQTNLPWKAQCINLDGERYTTIYVPHPDNNQTTYYSERDYGRFGSFFKTAVAKDKPLVINYRIVTGPGERTMEQVKATVASYTGK